MLKTLGLKIQLYPTKEQQKIMNRYFGVSRYVYNFGIEEAEKEYKETGLQISKYELANRLVIFKRKKENQWLNQFDATMMKNTLFDVDKAYRFFFNKKMMNRKPTYKRKKSSHQQFPIRVERMSIYENYVRIPGIKTNISCGYIPDKICIGKGYLPKTHPDYRKYIDARIVFNGLNYFLCLRMDQGEIASYKKYHEKNITKPYSDCIGIDFGFSRSNWIVDSNGNRVNLPDMSKEDKKISHFFRKFSRQCRTSRHKRRSKNSLKTLRQINKYYKRKTNMKLDTIHKYISHEIISKKPIAVVIEDIQASDFLIDKRNEKIKAKDLRKYNKNILEHCLDKFKTILQYKCEHNGINVIRADRSFPSSKRCSSCGNLLDIGRKRIYLCPTCGMAMNRDENAARNLAMYPMVSSIDGVSI